MPTIPLYRGGEVAAHAQVDDEDFDRLTDHDWRLHGDDPRYQYAARRGAHDSLLLMHREILGLTEPGHRVVVDHINHDTLDNRRGNLRAVTHSVNCLNRAAGNKGSSSQYQGVSWRAEVGKWRAYARIHGKLHYLGHHDDELEAARVAREFREAHMQSVA